MSNINHHKASQEPQIVKQNQNHAMAIVLSQGDVKIFTIRYITFLKGVSIITLQKDMKRHNILWLSTP